MPSGDQTISAKAAANPPTYALSGAELFPFVQTQAGLPTFTGASVQNFLSHGPWNKVYDPTSPQFGAKGDNATDDTAALQAWLNAIPNGGCGILPPRNYKITGTLSMIGKVGVLIYSPASTAVTPVGAFLRWHGDAVSQALLLSGCRDCVIQRLGINADTTLASAVRLETRTAFTATHNVFDHVYIAGGNRLTTGFETQPGSAGDNNNDINLWTFCQVVQIGPNGNGWVIGHGQSVDNVMFHCTAAGGGAAGGALGVNQVAGHFHWYAGSITGLDTMFKIGNATYPILIDGVGSEGTKRLLTTPNVLGNTSVTVRGVRFAGDSLASDGGMIQWGFEGTLLLEGNLFGSGAALPQVQSVHSSGGTGAYVISRGNQWGGGSSNGLVRFVNNFPSNPFYWRSQGDSFTDSTGHGAFSTVWGDSQAVPSFALTYGATVTPSAPAADFQTLSVTDGNAWTLAKPTNAMTAGMEFTLQITNNSGGNMGAVTLAGEYVLTGGALPTIPSGKSFHLRVRWDGTRCFELYRSPSVY